MEKLANYPSFKGINAIMAGRMQWMAREMKYAVAQSSLSIGISALR